MVNFLSLAGFMVLVTHLIIACGIHDFQFLVFLP